MVESFQEYVNEYKDQLAKGAIQKAYKGLMDYMLELRTYFGSKYPDYLVSGSLYFGYMDMTYFAITPKSLKDRGLKIAIVFLHESCRFEVWLAAYNKQIQTRYWKLAKASNWAQYRLVPTTQGADAIVEHVLAETPDFSDLATLTARIESETIKFISNVEAFLSTCGG